MKKGGFLNVFILMLGFVLSVGFSSSCSDKDDPDTKDPVKPETPNKPSYEATEKADPFSWVATDDRGKTIDPDLDNYPDPKNRKDKYVGVFYFIWHGCHGYDVGENHNSVQRPKASDVKSPYNVEELTKANPSEPAWGGGGVMHHWGEPYLGYYVADDEWVIRKHAQMLTDAGVDVILFDVTNAYHYVPVVKTICKVYTQMRKEGNATPQFAFLLNAGATATFNAINAEIYSKNLYKDLWFQWLGKPLILVNPDEVPAGERDKFTIRRSWYLYNNPGVDTWFGDGVDKWPWGGLYPQQAGIHDGKNEYVSVMSATHPTSNIGRSHSVSTGQPPTPRSGEGIYFNSQFKRALRLDPQFMLFTGWNEWTAQRQIAKNYGEVHLMGTPVRSGGTYFVDQYNHEFSRDMEPLNGDFGDNYYYMLADYIRQFKGTNSTPVYQETNTITVDGDMSDWKDVKALYGDDKGDTAHRNHFGWGRIGAVSNTTGRNDIILSKMTTDGTNLYFYVRTAEDLTSYKDNNWMQLFIRVDETKPSWEGYNFAVNRKTGTEKEAILEKCKGDWNWEEASKISYFAKNNEMELKIPLNVLGISTPEAFMVEFKWIDNAAIEGDIQTCMRDGDSAPNGRFRYRYTYEKE